MARAAASLCRASKGRAAASAVRVLLRAGVRLGYVTANAAAKPDIGLHRQREPVIWSPDQAAHMAGRGRRHGLALHRHCHPAERMLDVSRFVL